MTAIHIGVAIPAGSTRVVLSGLLPNGEEWSTGFFMTGISPVDPSNLTLMAQHIATVLDDGAMPNAMYSTMSHLCNPLTSWTTTTLYNYATAGNKASTIGAYVWPTPKTGGLSNGIPEQCAVVVTLRTVLAGRSHRGRMYLPCTGANLQVDGQLQSTVVDELAAGWANAFLQLQVGDIPNVVIVSNVLSTVTPIYQVKVDSKVDTMRSRAKSASIDHTAQVAVYH